MKVEIPTCDEAESTVCFRAAIIGWVGMQEPGLSGSRPSGRRAVPAKLATPVRLVTSGGAWTAWSPYLCLEGGWPGQFGMRCGPTKHGAARPDNEPFSRCEASRLIQGSTSRTSIQRSAVRTGLPGVNHPPPIFQKNPAQPREVWTDSLGFGRPKPGARSESPDCRLLFHGLSHLKIGPIRFILE